MDGWMRTVSAGLSLVRVLSSVEMSLMSVMDGRGREEGPTGGMMDLKAIESSARVEGEERGEQRKKEERNHRKVAIFNRQKYAK